MSKPEPEHVPAPIMRHFQGASRIPEGKPRDVFTMLADVAHWIDRELPNGAEKATALRKILEGKDAAVRAALE